MNRTLSISGWMAGVTFAGLALFACSRAGELCSAECDCELCSDRKYDMCKIEMNSNLDEANAYDCGDDYDAYLDCRLDRAQCDHHSWHLDQNDCQSELTRYHDCVTAASSLDNNVTPPGNNCNCTCTCGSAGGQDATCTTGVGCCTAACMALCALGDAGAFAPPAGETCTGG
jgi:hypothetical protein